MRDPSTQFCHNPSYFARGNITIHSRERRYPGIASRLHILAIVSFLGLAMLGHLPDSIGGWISCPPVRYEVCASGRRRSKSRWREISHRGQWRVAWRYVCLTWQVSLGRSVVLGALWAASGQMGPPWIVGMPLGVWAWRVVGVMWPCLSRQPEWRLLQGMGRLAEGGMLWAYAGLALGNWLRNPSGSILPLDEEWGKMWPMTEGDGSRGVLGLLLCVGGPAVTVSHDEEGRCYRAEIMGHFTLSVADDDRFRLRLLVLFLRLLELGATQRVPRRSSRRTRDGRTPFVRQQALETVLKIPQPHLSLWERYWLAGDWRRLLSQYAEEVLTLELQQKIIETWARLPHWSIERVHQLLVEQGVAVTESQVRQAAHESGWQIVRSVLARLCEKRAGELRLRDDWLVGDLLGQIRLLLDKLEAGEGLTAEERVDITALAKGCEEGGFRVPPSVKALPWLMRVERLVFGQWEAVTDGTVRCIYCGSSDVGRKSKRPRYKKYLDGEGQVQSIAVERYYCRNSQCEKGSFTNLPPGLVPYSHCGTEMHLLVFQMYEWGYSNYRRTGKAMGITSRTAYRWVSAWGQELLSVAALFGIVKSSGVVGVDEKYVLVPKNDKPEGEMRRWMYVYFAVDVYTYDLLHIAIYPHNNQESAEAFLLALRAKGYRPRAIVTDLRQDYGPVIGRVFPQAEHHECIFHALQNVEKYIEEVYGPDYVESHPEAEALKRDIYAIFGAKTKRIAERRYREIMGLREDYVKMTPGVAVVFDFLERHWPKLVNGIESDLIPTTNNTVELVIRRFDQHYQNFCGFESIESANRYLGVFEKVYRFTPFSQDAQPRIRTKSPLQLAGYDLSQLPITALCTGLSIIWPLEVSNVPNL